MNIPDELWKEITDLLEESEIEIVSYACREEHEYGNCRSDETMEKQKAWPEIVYRLRDIQEKFKSLEKTMTAAEDAAHAEGFRQGALAYEKQVEKHIAELEQHNKELEVKLEKFKLRPISQKPTLADCDPGGHVLVVGSNGMTLWSDTFPWMHHSCWTHWLPLNSEVLCLPAPETTEQKNRREFAEWMKTKSQVPTAEEVWVAAREEK